MLVIPSDNKSNYLDGIFDRVNDIDGIDVIYTKPIDLNKPGIINFNYDGSKYEMEVYISKFSIPKTYISKKYYFTDEELKKIESVGEAVTLSMKFHNNPKKDYSLQVKFAYTMFPDLIGLIDESAEKVLPFKWVKMVAESDVMVSPSDLYTVQAIYDEKGEVWLHTHGLNRCGITELEILNSSNVNYNNHYHLISSYANFLIDKVGDKYNPREDYAYIGVLSDRTPIVVTCRSWVNALSLYKKIKVGNKRDREKDHNGFSSVIFIYKSEADLKKNKVSKVNIYDNLWGDNPIFFVNNLETERMRKAARESFSYVLEAFENKDNHILIKIGIPVPKEYGNFEYIWFELLEVDNDKFKCSLTQEPYNAKDIHEGDTNWYTLNDVTDWIIYTKDNAITPSNVYILMK